MNKHPKNAWPRVSSSRICSWDLEGSRVACNLRRKTQSLAKHKSLPHWVYLRFSRGDPECSWRRYFETNVIIPVIFQISPTSSRGSIFLWTWAQDRVFWLESVDLRKHSAFVNFPEHEKEKWLRMTLLVLWHMAWGLGPEPSQHLLLPFFLDLQWFWPPSLTSIHRNRVFYSLPVFSLHPSPLASHLACHLLQLEPFYFCSMLPAPPPNLPLNLFFIMPFHLCPLTLFTCL